MFKMRQSSLPRSAGGQRHGMAEIAYLDSRFVSLPLKESRAIDVSDNFVSAASIS